MELKKRIDGNLKGAMLAKDTAKVTVLRGLKATILDMEVAEGKRDEGLGDAEIERLLMKEIKKRKEAIAMYEANGREDLVKSEQFEQGVLEGYLPEQMSEVEIVAKIDEVLKGVDGGAANLGMVIGQVKALVGNKADGATVARLVKERMAG